MSVIPPYKNETPGAGGTWISGRIRSILCAGKGLRYLLATQHNARLHAAATVIALLTSAALGLKAGEWALMFLAIALVWTAEALNTAIELALDAAVPEEHAVAGLAKDVAAGGVLLAVIGAVLIGLAVFGPRFIALAVG